MSADDLKTIRIGTGMPQRAFAQMMGVPLRTYEDLEAGRTTVRQVHLNAARWAVCELLAIDNDSDSALFSAQDHVADTISRAAKNLQKK